MFTRRTQLRPETAADRPFLRRLYDSTRQPEMDMLPHWSDERKDAFLAQQFHAQTTFYAEQFPDAKFDIVEVDGDPVGRLYVDRRDDEIRLIDIALLPEHRGLGLGGELMSEILAEGESTGLLVRIHVEMNNPAMSLYKRLGFRKIEEQGVYWLMEWTPRSRRPETPETADKA